MQEEGPLSSSEVSIYLAKTSKNITLNIQIRIILFGKLTLYLRASQEDSDLVGR